MVGFGGRPFDDARHEFNALQFILRVHDELIGQMRVAMALRIDEQVLAARLHHGVDRVVDSVHS